MSSVQFKIVISEMSQCKQKSMAVNLFDLVEKTQYILVTIRRSSRLVTFLVCNSIINYNVQ